MVAPMSGINTLGFWGLGLVVASIPKMHHVMASHFRVLGLHFRCWIAQPGSSWLPGWFVGWLIVWTCAPAKIRLERRKKWNVSVNEYDTSAQQKAGRRPNTRFLQKLNICVVHNLLLCAICVFLGSWASINTLGRFHKYIVLRKNVF